MIINKYKKTRLLFLIVIVMPLVTSVAFAQTDIPTPTGDSDTGVIDKLKQIETLKEKIATKVAEIRENEKGGVTGSVKKIDGNNIVLTTRKGENSFIFNEDTLIYTLSNGKKSDAAVKNLREGDTATALGYFNETKDTFSAKYIYIQEPFLRISGKIADIDKKNYTITVKDKSGDVIVDIETYTRTIAFTPPKGSGKSGFSKYKVADFVYIWGIPNQKEENRMSAQRITLIPSVDITPTPETEEKLKLTASPANTINPTAKPTE